MPTPEEMHAIFKDAGWLTENAPTYVNPRIQAQRDSAIYEAPPSPAEVEAAAEQARKTAENIRKRATGEA